MTWTAFAILAMFLERRTNKQETAIALRPAITFSTLWKQIDQHVHKSECIHTRIRNNYVQNLILYVKNDIFRRNATQFVARWKSRIFPGILSGFLFVQICLPRYFPSSFPCHRQHSKLRDNFCSLLLPSAALAKEILKIWLIAKRTFLAVQDSAIGDLVTH